MISFETNLFLLSHGLVLAQKIGGTALKRGFFRGTDDEKTFVSGRIKENCRKLGYMLKPEGVKENLKKITRKFNTTLFEI